MAEDGSSFLIEERLLRQDLIAGRSDTLAGVATDEERRYYYHMSKKGMGFTPEDRRRIWLQVTGAQGLLNTSRA